MFESKPYGSQQEPRSYCLFPAGLLGGENKHRERERKSWHLLMLISILSIHYLFVFLRLSDNHSYFKIISFCCSK